jgi:hypothetical protein
MQRKARVLQRVSQDSRPAQRGEFTFPPGRFRAFSGAIWQNRRQPYHRGEAYIDLRGGMGLLQSVTDFWH